MLRTHQNQLTLWEAILPEPLLNLPAELEYVDQILDDERFMVPFLEKFNTVRGRPTVPVQTYLRLMYLKFRYQLGYETLVREVSDSLAWRRFSHIPIDGKVPDASTLIKARKRYGEDTVEQLNELLVKKLSEQKVIRHRKFRTDTTVVESDIHHPTDATLLQDGIRAITRTVNHIRQLASHATEGFVDQTDAVKNKVLSFAKVLRRRMSRSWDEVNRITQDVVDITQNVLQQAESVVEKLQRTKKPPVEAQKEKLQSLVDKTKQLLGQAKEVIGGNRIIPDRIISIHDAEARPIKKGKLAKKVEFGYKVRIDETESGFVTGYAVYTGNPSDDDLLIPAVQHHKEIFGSAPHAVATDRGFSSRKNERALQEEFGVRYVSTPFRGKKGKARTELERAHWYRNLQRFRAAGEAKIALLKQKYGLGRSRFRGHSGTSAWVGYGIMAHNLRRAAQVGR
ncbi:ISNCY family transposase [Alicyclobacillus shizuokensis]|uniref:ISNCY family transposase n=1 Tax=Alicyclobacillus shizuokensis TaxID=392014 RepID=UPI00082BBB07|nr:ISNCY family transposase [Alicyclobacillus shizuokensis]